METCVRSELAGSFMRLPVVLQEVMERMWYTTRKTLSTTSRACTQQTGVIRAQCADDQAAADASAC